jgi:tripartite ATP-independent transporter DctM subunit
MRGLLVRGENAFATLVAIAVIVLPLAEIAVRNLFTAGIPGAGPFTQHLTMWVALLGAAIAARDGKLLALATGSMLPEGRVREAARAFSGFVAAAISTVFAFGAVEYVRNTHEAGREIAAGVAEWTAELALPIGFALIAVRVAWFAATTWRARAVALLGLAAGAWIALNQQVFLEGPGWPFVVVLIVATILGAPLFVLLGGMGLMLFLTKGVAPFDSIISGHAQLTGETLPAIPLFTLAGFLLAEGRASERLLRLFRAFFGWMPGGTAVVTTLLCALFTLLTGGSGVTILALGGLLLPTLLADGYRERFSLGLITSAGSLGLLFPLSLPLLLYAVVAGQDPAISVQIEDLFIAGLLPGALMLGMLALWGVREGLVVKTTRYPFHWREAAGAAWMAKWEILLPFVIVGSIFVMGATTSEAAAVTALYALVVQWFLQRDLKTVGDVTRAVGNSVALSGGVLIILAAAVAFTQFLVWDGVPDRLQQWTETNVTSKWIFLLGLNGVLIVVGALMDIFSATVVVVPLVAPIAAHFGIDPVHLGIVFVANAELGYLMPPVGENLFLSSYRFNKPILHVARATVPMIIILTIGVLLITYFEFMTIGVLELFGRR